jgi:hypothetical protein
MEQAGSSETLVSIYQTARRNVSLAHSLDIYRREELKPQNNIDLLERRA